MKAGKPIQAQEKFAVSLLRHPNRIRSLTGSARAANAKGDKETAKENYHQLLAQLEKADPDLKELKEADSFLKGHSVSGARHLE